MPPEIERALSAVAEMQVLVRSRSSCVVDGDRSHLLREWRSGPQLLYSGQQSFAVAGEVFHFTERRYDSTNREKGDSSEFAFDGVDVRTSSKAGSFEIFPRHRYDVHQKDARVFFPEYIDAMGIDVSNQPQRIGSLPASRVLQDLYAGASLERVGTSTMFLVKRSLTQRAVRSTWIDMARQGAVTRSQIHVGDRLFFESRNKDFQRVGEIFFPRSIELRYHGWSSVPDVASEKPRMIRHVEVTELRGEPTAKDLAFAGRVGGTVVIDHRYSTFGTSRDDFMAYHVAVSEDELCEGFDRVWTPSPESDLFTWILIHLGTLGVLWLGMFAVNPKRRP